MVVLVFPGVRPVIAVYAGCLLPLLFRGFILADGATASTSSIGANMTATSPAPSSTVCTPSCAAGLICVNESECVYRLSHTGVFVPQDTEDRGLSFSSSLEYLAVDDLTNSSNWVAAAGYPKTTTSPPTYVDVPANHTGTYFRSKIDVMDASVMVTVSLATAGTAPAGYPTFSWGSFPFVQLSSQDGSGGNASLNVPGIPTVLQSAYPSLQLEVYNTTGGVVVSRIISSTATVVTVDLPGGQHAYSVLPWNGGDSNYTRRSLSVHFVNGDPAAIIRASRSSDGAVCSPACTQGRWCIASQTCQFRMLHDFKLSNSTTEQVPPTLNASAEYLVSLTNGSFRWLPAPISNRDGPSFPSTVDIPAGFNATYYRSRMDLARGNDLTTVSLIYSGTPPNGYLSLNWGDYPYVDFGLINNDIGQAIINLPSLTPSSLNSLHSRIVEYGNVGNASTVVALSLPFAASAQLIRNLSHGQYFVRVRPQANSPVVAGATQPDSADLLFIVGHPSSPSASDAVCSSVCTNGTVCHEGFCQFILFSQANASLLNSSFPAASRVFRVFVERLVYSADHPVGVFVSWQLFRQVSDSYALQFRPSNVSSFYRSSLSVEYGNYSDGSERTTTVGYFEAGSTPDGFFPLSWGSYPYVLNVTAGAAAPSARVLATLRLPTVPAHAQAFHPTAQVVWNLHTPSASVLFLPSNSSAVVLDCSLGQQRVLVHLLHASGNSSLAHASPELFFHTDNWHIVFPTTASPVTSATSQGAATTATTTTAVPTQTTDAGVSVTTAVATATSPRIVVGAHSGGGKSCDQNAGLTCLLLSVLSYVFAALF